MNLLQTSVYKPNQGRIVRQLTALASLDHRRPWAAGRLYATLRGNLEVGIVSDSRDPRRSFCWPVAWFGYRVVNWPRFADFLIAVEAEMNKVTWPSKDELIRASIVVIFTIFFLAIALFLFDIVWQQLFSLLRSHQLAAPRGCPDPIPPPRSQCHQR